MDEILNKNYTHIAIQFKCDEYPNGTIENIPTLYAYSPKSFLEKETTFKTGNRKSKHEIGFTNVKDIILLNHI